MNVNGMDLYSILFIEGLYYVLYMKTMLSTVLLSLFLHLCKLYLHLLLHYTVLLRHQHNKNLLYAIFDHRESILSLVHMCFFIRLPCLSFTCVLFLLLCTWKRENCNRLQCLLSTCASSSGHLVSRSHAHMCFYLCH